MKKERLIILWIFGILVLSCTQKPNSSNDIETINIDLNCPVEYAFTDFMDIERVVALETAEEALISGIDRLIIKNNRIYTFAARQRVHIFSAKGKYLNSVGHKGKGPSEMILATDFDLSPDGKQIALWDRDGHKVLIFKTNGDFIKQIVSKDIQWVFRFCWLQENRFLLSSLYIPQESVDGAFQAYLLDESMNVIKGLIPYDEKFERLGIGGKVFQKYENGTTYFRHPIEGTVFKIEDDMATKNYHFSFGQNELKDARKVEYVKDNRLMHKDYIHATHAILIDFQELNDWFYTRYRFEGKDYSLCINKTSGLQKRYRHTLSFDFLTDIRVLAVSKDRLVAMIEPFRLKEKLAKISDRDREKYNKEVEFWENIVNDKADADNPFIVFMKPKRFES